MLEPRLYLAAPADWHFVVSQIPGQHEIVLCVGHNPGLEELLHRWSGESIEMPTAAIAVVEVLVNRWEEIDRCTFTVSEVLRPKERE